MESRRVCGFCGDFWRGGWGFQSVAKEIDEKFCSRACLNAWRDKMEFSKFEIEAIENMLQPMGDYVAKSGIMDKPFSECSRDEILGLFATTIRTFRVSFQDALGDDVPF